MASVIGITPAWVNALDKVEGVDVVSDGHSYGVVNAGGTNVPRRTWFNRVQTRISAASYTNRNVGGAQAADTAGVVANGAAPGTRQLALWDCTINDVNHSAPASNGLSGYAAAVRTYLLIMRSAQKWEAETSSTVSGTWTSTNDSYASGGSIQSTTAQNAAHSYAVSGATSWVVLLGGGVGSTAMGTATIAVDGTTVATVTLTGIYASTQNNGNRTWFPYAVPVTVPNTAAHTITVTKTDATTNPVYDDALYVASVAPPLIVLSKAIYPTTSALSGFNNSGGPNPTPSTVDQFNGQLVSTANGIAADGTILISDPQALGFNNTTMVSTDGLHPNDYGAAFIASAALNAVRQSQIYVPGVGYGITATQTGTVTAPSGAATTYAADTFTRSNSTTSLGTTETGGYTWVNNSGPWGVTSNQAVNITYNGGADNDAYIDDGQANGTIQLTNVTTQNQGVMFRGSGTNNTTCYIFWNNGSGYSLSKRTATNSYSLIQSSATPTGAANDVLKVVLNGSAIKCSVNGTQIISVTDTSYTGTRHGFFTINGQVTFDSFTHTSATT